MPDLLQKLDALAVRMLAEGRMPSPALLVQALLNAGVSLQGPVRLERPDPATSAVAFVSPNTGTGATIREAYDQMRGPEMASLAKQASALPGVKGGESGVGFWSDGAEASHLIHADPAAVAAAAEQLGRAFKQKSVLWFTGGAGGDKYHTLVVPHNDPERVHNDMMRHGIEYKTVVPAGDRSVVHVVDMGDTIGPQIAAYARESGAEHKTQDGTAHFLALQ